MNDQYHTVGEIFRKGMLRNHDGKPYKHKASVLNVVRGLKHRKVNTPWGPSLQVRRSEIAKHNKSW